MSTQRDLEFLYEIGTLRFIQRTWRQFLLPDVSNVAEHILRVIWIALILAKMEKIKNIDKIVKMALVHDITESRTGDVHYLSGQFTERFEEKAIKEILNQTSLEEFKQIWREYEKRETVEAKIAKDADNLDVELELKEQSSIGNQVRKDWLPMRKKVGQNFLYTKSAKKLWQEIQKSNPHNWHLNANNRFNAGDWKNKTNEGPEND